MPNFDRLPLTLAALLLAAGCSHGPSADGDDADGSTAAGETDDAPGPETDGDSEDAPGTDTDADAPPVDNCEDVGLSVGPSPLRRLSRVEIAHTIADILGPDLPVDAAMPSDETAYGYDANSVKLATPEDVELMVAFAEQVADAAVEQHGDALFPCDVAETPCVDGFLADVGARLYRRPLLAEERDALVAMYEQNRDAYNPRRAVKLMLQAMLASPNFLYLVEVGEPAEPGAAAAPLTGHELAARLSYFLWNSAPDDALRAAAESGELSTLAGLEAQARRLLDDPRAERTVAGFVEQWLGLRGVPDVTKQAAAYPEWTPALGEAMLAETRRFAADVVFAGDARLSTLLTRPTTTIGPDLAALYGVPWPEGLEEPLAELELDPAQRAGILTHASVLTRTAHADEGSWVHRGLVVRDRMLCQPMPPPPKDVPMSDLNNPDRVTDPACKGCHVLMDPLGQGSDNYDAIGRYAALLDGADPLGRARGEVIASGDAAVDGEFFGAVDLSARLADSPVVSDCVTTHWFRYAHKRGEHGDDRCGLRDLRARFAASGGDMRELLVEIALSDAFRHIRPDPGA
jgi:hypothetical protein